jgi:hypothetical protein
VFKEAFGAITPFTETTVEAYEENQLKLTGIIESSEFVEGFRAILLQIMCFFLKETFSCAD